VCGRWCWHCGVYLGCTILAIGGGGFCDIPNAQLGGQVKLSIATSGGAKGFPLPARHPERMQAETLQAGVTQVPQCTALLICAGKGFTFAPTVQYKFVCLDFEWRSNIARVLAKEEAMRKVESALNRWYHPED